MGTFPYPITIANPRTGEQRELEAVVDSGATFVSVPVLLLNDFGIDIARRVSMQLADGTLIETPLGNVDVIIDGESTPSACLFPKCGIRKEH